MDFEDPVNEPVDLNFSPTGCWKPVILLLNSGSFDYLSASLSQPLSRSINPAVLRIRIAIFRTKVLARTLI
jgi:hypothetical protein